MTLTKKMKDKIVARRLRTDEVWADAVISVLSQEGFDIVDVNVRLEEEAIRANGLEDEYMDALVSVTKASLDNQMALVTATGEQRRMACALVRIHQKTNSDNKGNN